MAYVLVSYIFPQWRRPVARLFLLLVLPAPGAADTVYHWTDAAGTPHFSDIAPAGPPAGRRELEPAAGTASAQGLRPGEKAALQTIERRLDLQHRRAQLARRQNDRDLAKRRNDCRERRARQHRTGNHAARKENTTYLRQNCW